MFQQLWALLPKEPGNVTLILAVLGSIAGAALWLTGSRYSIYVLVLTAVSLGTVIGMKLPLWCGWSVDEMGPAVGGAVILGVSAYAIHRFWVGLWLGLALAGWVALVLWNIATPRHGFAWPAVGDQTLPMYLGTVWSKLPGSMQHGLPWFGGAALLAGLLTAMVWPKVGLVTMWSVVGVSMFVATATIALIRLSPGAVNHLPRQTTSQAAILGAVVFVGALLQWHWMPQGGGSGAGSKSPAKSD